MYNVIVFALMLISLLAPIVALSEPEAFYQGQWCQQAHGHMEYVLPDMTRVDCLTATHAIEFDFGKKWAEAIGQSLYYSASTGRRAGIVLILKNEKDVRYLNRINKTIQSFDLPIDVWRIEAYGD